MNNPLQRNTALIIEEVAGDTIVYDEISHRAHCLNPTAARVWRRCDGRTPAGEIATALSAELASRVDPAVVRLAIRELGELGLLEGPPAVFEARASRREAIRKMAAAGGALALLPAITSIVAPTPAQAQSADYHDSGGSGNALGRDNSEGNGNPGRGHGRGGGNSGQGRGNYGDEHGGDK